LLEFKKKSIKLKKVERKMGLREKKECECCLV